MRNLLIAQFILVLLASVAFLTQGPGQALAALYGGAVALANSLLMLRRILRATRATSGDPKADVQSLFLGALERFVVTLSALAIGMGWLRLEPIALLVGFAVAYLGHPLSRLLPAAGPQARDQL